METSGNIRPWASLPPGNSPGHHLTLLTSGKKEIVTHILATILSYPDYGAITVFWKTTPCTQVEEPCCLRFQGTLNLP